jgi:hypothetical protein
MVLSESGTTGGVGLPTNTRCSGPPLATLALFHLVVRPGRAVELRPFG